MTGAGRGTARGDVVAPDEARQIVLDVYANVTPTAMSATEDIRRRTSMAQRPESSAGTVFGAIAVSFAMAVCCGGALLVSIGGFGVIAAFLFSPWALLPIFGLGTGLVYWRRRGARPGAADICGTTGSAVRR